MATLYEVDLEEMIHKASQSYEGSEMLKAKGLELPLCILTRQFYLGPYGMPDLVGFSFHGEHEKKEVGMHIYEVKGVLPSPDHLEQIAKYRVGGMTFLKELFPDHHHTCHVTLIARKDTNSNAVFYPYLFGMYTHMVMWDFGIAKGIEFTPIDPNFYLTNADFGITDQTVDKVKQTILPRWPKDLPIPKFGKSKNGSGH